MIKKLSIGLLALFTFGCSLPTQCTEQREFVQKRTLDPKTGWVEEFKGSYEASWGD